MKTDVWQVQFVLVAGLLLVGLAFLSGGQFTAIWKTIWGG